MKVYNMIEQHRVFKPYLLYNNRTFLEIFEPASGSRSVCQYTVEIMGCLYQIFFI